MSEFDEFKIGSIVKIHPRFEARYTNDKMWLGQIKRLVTSNGIGYAFIKPIVKTGVYAYKDIPLSEIPINKTFGCVPLEQIQPNNTSWSLVAGIATTTEYKPSNDNDVGTRYPIHSDTVVSLDRFDFSVMNERYFKLITLSLYEEHKKDKRIVKKKRVKNVDVYNINVYVD